MLQYFYKALKAFFTCSKQLRFAPMSKHSHWQSSLLNLKVKMVNSLLSYFAWKKSSCSICGVGNPPNFEPVQSIKLAVSPVELATTAALGVLLGDWHCGMVSNCPVQYNSNSYLFWFFLQSITFSLDVPKTFSPLGWRWRTPSHTCPQTPRTCRPSLRPGNRDNRVVDAVDGKCISEVDDNLLLSGCQSSTTLPHAMATSRAPS